ncbi:MAG: hypothetical protein JST30_16580 [Armatimonadetes bacterium]|nr:hypothetical protein [Armatimonadota bacterium]
MVANVALAKTLFVMAVVVLCLVFETFAAKATTGDWQRIEVEVFKTYGNPPDGWLRRYGP